MWIKSFWIVNISTKALDFRCLLLFCLLYFGTLRDSCIFMMAIKTADDVCPLFDFMIRGNYWQFARFFDVFMHRIASHLSVADCLQLFNINCLFTHLLRFISLYEQTNSNWSVCLFNFPLWNKYESDTRLPALRHPFNLLIISYTTLYIIVL